MNCPLMWHRTKRRTTFKANAHSPINPWEQIAQKTTPPNIFNAREEKHPMLKLARQAFTWYHSLSSYYSGDWPCLFFILSFKRCPSEVWACPYMKKEALGLTQLLQSFELPKIKRQAISMAHAIVRFRFGSHSNGCLVSSAPACAEIQSIYTVQ